MPDVGIGATPFYNGALSNTAVAVAAYPCNLYYIHVVNPNTTDIFLQVFDVAQASVVVGTTTPTQSYIIPGGTGASNRGGFEEELAFPVRFATALTVACTTGASNATAPSTAAIVNLAYK